MPHEAPNPLLKSAHERYSFRVPDRPWVLMDAKHINPLASLAPYRANPAMTMLILVEDVSDRHLDEQPRRASMAVQ